MVNFCSHVHMAIDDFSAPPRCADFKITLSFFADFWIRVTPKAWGLVWVGFCLLSFFGGGVGL